MPTKPRPTRPTALMVRQFGQANPERFAHLTDKAQHTLVSRGQLHQSVIDTYNKGVKPERQYVRGQSKAVKADTAEARKGLIESGLAGKRGPLSKAAQESLSAKG